MAIPPCALSPNGDLGVADRGGGTAASRCSAPHGEHLYAWGTPRSWKLSFELAGPPLAEIKLLSADCLSHPSRPRVALRNALKSRTPPLGVHPGQSPWRGSFFRSRGTYTVPKETRGLSEYHLTPCS